MDRELTPEEIAELLPAYALDAVDDDERAAIDAYLTSHPEERDALADLQVTASMLAHTGGPPPDGVWERLESIIATTPPPQRIVPPTVLTPRSAPVTANGPIPSGGGGGWLRPPWSSPSRSAGSGSRNGATAAVARPPTRPRWRPPRRRRPGRATSRSPTRAATRSRPRWSRPTAPAT